MVYRIDLKEIWGVVPRNLPFVPFYQYLRLGLLPKIGKSLPIKSYIIEISKNNAVSLTGLKTLLQMIHSKAYKNRHSSQDHGHL